MSEQPRLRAVPDVDEATATKTLANVAAETELLGILLAAPHRFAEVADVVTGADFFRGSHRTIFEAIEAVSASGETVAPVAVGDELDRHGHLESVGGLVMLTELQHQAGPTANAAHVAGIIADLARRRRVRDSAFQLANAICDRTADVDDILASRVDDMLSHREGRGIVHVGQFADDLWTLWDKGPQSEGVDTGWPTVDQKWRPAPGQLVIVAGIPGHGKSAWLDALAVNVSSLHGWRHVMWSPESMPFQQHASRLIARQAGRPYDRLDSEQLIRGEAWAREHFAWIDPDVHDTPAAILAQVRAEHDRRPVNAFYIDPWTEIDHSRERNLREDEFLSRELTRIRRFARRHGLVAFVAVHPKQMEPSRMTGVWPVPTAGDLAGGATWNKKADALLVVWRDETGKEQRSILTELHVRKIRRNGVDGQMGSKVTLEFEIATGRYRSWGGGASPAAADPRQPY